MSSSNRSTKTPPAGTSRTGLARDRERDRQARPRKTIDDERSYDRVAGVPNTDEGVADRVDPNSAGPYRRGVSQSSRAGSFGRTGTRRIRTGGAPIVLPHHRRRRNERQEPPSAACMLFRKTAPARLECRDRLRMSLVATPRVEADSAPTSVPAPNLGHIRKNRARTSPRPPCSDRRRIGTARRGDP